MAVKGCKKACISTAVDENDDDTLWNGWKRMGMLGVSMRKMKALTKKMEIVTLIGKGGQNQHALYIKCLHGTKTTTQSQSLSLVRRENKMYKLCKYIIHS
jgi:hypothetical protein